MSRRGIAGALRICFGSGNHHGQAFSTRTACVALHRHLQRADKPRVYVGARDLGCRPKMPSPRSSSKRFGIRTPSSTLHGPSHQRHPGLYKGYRPVSVIYLSDDFLRTCLSIQMKSIPSARVTLIASWNVFDNGSQSIFFFRSSRLALVVMSACVLPQQ